VNALSKTIIAVIAGFLLLQTAAAQTTLTNDSVVKMVKAGLAEDVVLSMINTQASQFSITPDEMINLKKNGVTDKVITAMLTKGQPASNSKPATPSATLAPNAVDAAAALEAGVYFKKKDEWIEVLPEVVNWKTGGVLKNIASAGIVKGDVNGRINGGHSKNGVLTPLEFLIKTPEGVAITEYQLIQLREDKDGREFRTVTGGVLHVSGGATRDLLPFESKKLSNRTYSIALPNLGIGEYGFLPPGAITSSNSASSLGRMYTFRVAE
jgi:hypothetical protein